MIFNKFKAFKHHNIVNDSASKQSIKLNEEIVIIGIIFFLTILDDELSIFANSPCNFQYPKNYEEWPSVH